MNEIRPTLNVDRLCIFIIHSMLAISQKVVTPVKTGVQVFCNGLEILDPGFHRDDGKRVFSTFYKDINVGRSMIDFRRSSFDNEWSAKPENENPAAEGRPFSLTSYL